MNEKVFDSNQDKMVDKNEPPSTESVEVQIARHNFEFLESINNGLVSVNNNLVSVNDNLKSINSKLTFFVILAIISIGITLLNSCGSLLGIK